MAVIKCALKRGKLKVIEVIEFQPGDTIKFDKIVPLFGKPSDCLNVKSPFTPGQTVEKHWVSTCPGN
jgi:hypothetical protein